MGRVPCVLSAASVVIVGGLALTPTAAQDTPTFRAGVEQVTVDAVVLDRDGEPVAGLGREDFELRDDGEPREILSFEALNLTTEPVPLSREARRVATNVAARAGRVMAVFWDDVHLSPPFAERARRALRPWLAKRLAGGDHIVVASAGGAWHVADDAEEEATLLRVLDGLKGEDRLPAADPEYVSDYEATAISLRGDSMTYEVVYRRFAARGVFGCARASLAPGELWQRRVGDSCPVLDRAREVAFTARTRLETTLRALAHLADVLAVGRGRKSIVLISEGFLQHPDSSGEFAAMARAAQQANAVLSFLDPAGLRGDATFSAAHAGAPAPEDRALVQASLLADQAGSERLARDTGGLVLRTNDLAGGLAQIARESQTHYLLGFEPPPDAEAGAFRRISLKVRRAGLTVRARSGYTVGGEPPRSSEEELGRVLDAPFDLPEHPLRVAAWVLDPRPPDRSRVVLGVEVAPPPGMTVPGADPVRLDLLVVVQGEDRDWRQRRELTFQPRADSAESPTEGWQLAPVEVELPAGTFRARAVVRKSDGRVSGAVTHVFEVPPAGTWHLSTPLLSPSVLVGPDGRTTVPRPTTRREFGTGGTLHGQFAVYSTPGDPDAAVDRLSGSWILRRRDAAGSEFVGTLPLAASKEGGVACRFSLPFRGLAAGEYELALRIRDELDGRDLEDVERITVRSASGKARSPGARQASPPDSARVHREAPVDPELASLLERAGRYVVEYEQSFSNLVAEETYTQWAGTRHRVTRADLVFVRLPGDIPWSTFRDVFEVDGQKIRDRSARLERLFLEPTSSSLDRARAILKESAAYNIGPAVRNVNTPTLPLAFLHPRNQHRFVFDKRGQRRIAGVMGVEVGFEEVARPTLIRTTDDDLPATGRFWIDPHRGTVLRSETRLHFRRTHATALITTEYRPEPALAMWVPSVMREQYRDNPGSSWLLFRVSTDADARYSNFRRFGVTVDERARLPEPESADEP